MVAYAYNFSAQEAEARDSWVWDQPGLPSKTLSQKENFHTLKSNLIPFLYELE
jgi:hypothetical protein